MKKLILLLSITFFCFYSCQNGEKKLNGKYTVIGCENKPEYSPEDIISLEAINFGEIPFEFSENKVKLSPEMSKHFLGYTEFEYQINDKQLTLTNLNEKIKINLVGHHGPLILNYDGKYLNELSLIPIH